MAKKCFAVSRSRSSRSTPRVASPATPSKLLGFEIVQEFYDEAVSGADPVHERPGFSAMLARIEGNGVRAILVVWL